MFNFWLLVGSAVVVVTAAFVGFWSWVFIPTQKSSLSSVVKKRLNATADSTDVTSAEINQLRRKALADWCRKKPVIGMSEQKYNALLRLTDAMDSGSNKKTVPEDIYFLQLMIGGFYTLIIAVLTLVLQFPLLLFAMAATPLIIKLPLWIIKDGIEQETKEIVFQFPDFYDAVYSQYSVINANVLMSEVVEPYIFVASSSFQKMLKRFMIDLQAGDQKGLEALAERYAGDQIISKFCSIMLQRLKGDPAALITMEGFRKSLQADVRDFRLKDLARRKKWANRLTIGLVLVVFNIIAAIYVGVSIAM